jgi:hypothetical protein
MLKLNGAPVNGGSAKIRIGNTLFNTLQAVNVKEAMDHQDVTAIGTLVPIGSTDGAYSAEGDIELLLQEAQLLVKACADAHPKKAWGKHKFNVLIQIDNEVDPIIEIELVDCKIKEASGGIQPGSDKLTAKIPLKVQYITRDGLVMAGIDAFKDIL